MQAVETYQKVFIEYLENYSKPQEPINLYEPINYILRLGGKRLRPVLALMTTDIFGGNYKDSLDAALAIEVFHNFTLIHDDIMDDAPLRRGKETVHEKWDLNTGILSGDAMLIMAYMLFEGFEASIQKELIQLFNKTALEVCEGQQYDIDFETRDDVTIDEYLTMIKYKTSVLVAAAMKMGAIIAKAPKEDQNKIYDFGLNLGLAFQLQDDYLDAFGNPETFGKQVGGDIIENKKTYLYLKALEQSDNSQKEELQHLYSIVLEENEDKIASVKDIFEDSGAANITKEAIKKYTFKAFEVLDSLSISEEQKESLKHFGAKLMNRSV